ncbi:centrosomal protein of 295 kDa isoform X10 [Monodelphis domestica]|uniref:centrosomal protein of 295 kDa isoform X10 n=1 Tax=Monodelphis domestica TaxID=13616 RepID=UPI0024E1AA30|nr:centrosomal protein of 295 kDa isoform X10 [Monodelphis domestica]
MKRKVTKVGNFRLSPNEEAFLLKEEYERRRKQRLLQVREQERYIALQIRQEVKQRRDQHLHHLAEELKEEWQKKQEEKIKELEKLYIASLKSVGEAHRDAKENEPDVEYLAKQTEERQQRAEERGRKALKKVKNQKEKLLKQKTWYVENRKKVLLEEKERAAKIASLPPPPPNPFENIHIKEISTLKTNSANIFPTYHHLDPTIIREEDLKQNNHVKEISALKTSSANSFPTYHHLDPTVIREEVLKQNNHVKEISALKTSSANSFPTYHHLDPTIIREKDLKQNNHVKEISALKTSSANSFPTYHHLDPTIIREKDLKQNNHVKEISALKTSSANSFPTHHHLDPTVIREEVLKQPDPHLAAEEETKRMEELQKEAIQERREQLEKAHIRGVHAMRKVHMAKSQEKIMKELEQLQQEDLVRRRQNVAQMPPQVVELPYKRMAIKEDWQRELEFAFEDMYNEDRKVKGDLILKLEPEPLPVATEHIQDGELDLSMEQDYMSEIENQERMEEKTPLFTETEMAPGTYHVPSTFVFKKLLDKIQSQRSQWANKYIPEDESEVAKIFADGESETLTVETGTIASEEKPLHKSEHKQEQGETKQLTDIEGETKQPTGIEGETFTTELEKIPKEDPLVNFTLSGEKKESSESEISKPDEGSVSLHPHEEATPIRTVMKRQKQIMKLEQQKQKQLELIRQIEQQKIRLENDCLKARKTQLEHERKKMKERTQQFYSRYMKSYPFMDQWKKETYVASQHLIVDAPTLGLKISREDWNKQMIHNYQQQLLQQKRFHRQSIDAARKRLHEFQNMLKQKYPSISTKSFSSDFAKLNSEPLDRKTLTFQSLSYHPRVPELPSLHSRPNYPAITGDSHLFSLESNKRLFSEQGALSYSGSQLIQPSESSAAPESKFGSIQDLFSAKSQIRQPSSHFISSEDGRFISSDHSLAQRDSLKTMQKQLHVQKETLHISEKIPEELLVDRQQPELEERILSDQTGSSSLVTLSGRIQEPFAIKNESIVPSSHSLMQIFPDKLLFSSEDTLHQQCNLSTIQEQLNKQKKALYLCLKAQESLGLHRSASGKEKVPSSRVSFSTTSVPLVPQHSLSSTVSAASKSVGIQEFHLTGSETISPSRHSTTQDRYWTSSKPMLAQQDNWKVIKDRQKDQEEMLVQPKRALEKKLFPDQTASPFLQQHSFTSLPSTESGGMQIASSCPSIPNIMQMCQEKLSGSSEHILSQQDDLNLHQEQLAGEKKALQISESAQQQTILNERLFSSQTNEISVPSLPQHSSTPPSSKSEEIQNPFVAKSNNILPSGYSTILVFQDRVSVLNDSQCQQDNLKEIQEQLNREKETLHFDQRSLLRYLNYKHGALEESTSSSQTDFSPLKPHFSPYSNSSLPSPEAESKSDTGGIQEPFLTNQNTLSSPQLSIHTFQDKLLASSKHFSAAQENSKELQKEILERRQKAHEEWLFRRQNSLQEQLQQYEEAIKDSFHENQANKSIPQNVKEIQSTEQFTELSSLSQDVRSNYQEELNKADKSKFHASELLSENSDPDEHTGELQNREQRQRLSKPPVAKIRSRLDLNQHELSTIQEVESPKSGRVYTREKRECYGEVASKSTLSDLDSSKFEETVDQGRDPIRISINRVPSLGNISQDSNQSSTLQTTNPVHSGNNNGQDKNVVAENHYAADLGQEMPVYPGSGFKPKKIMQYVPWSINDFGSQSHAQEIQHDQSSLTISSGSFLSNENFNLNLTNSEFEQTFPHLHHQIFYHLEPRCDLDFSSSLSPSGLSQDLNRSTYPSTPESQDAFGSRESTTSTTATKTNLHSVLDIDLHSSLNRMTLSFSQTKDFPKEKITLAMSEEPFQPLQPESTPGDRSHSADLPSIISIEAEGPSQDSRNEKFPLRKQYEELLTQKGSGHFSPSVENLQSPTFSSSDDPDLFGRMKVPHSTPYDSSSSKSSTKDPMESKKENLGFEELSDEMKRSQTEIIAGTQSETDSRCSVRDPKTVSESSSKIISIEENVEIFRNTPQRPPSSFLISLRSCSSIPVWETESGQGIMEEAELTLISSSGNSVIESEENLIQEENKESELNSCFRETESGQGIMEEAKLTLIISSGNRVTESEKNLIQEENKESELNSCFQVKQDTELKDDSFWKSEPPEEGPSSSLQPPGTFQKSSSSPGRLQEAFVMKSFSFDEQRETVIKNKAQTNGKSQTKSAPEIKIKNYPAERKFTEPTLNQLKKVNEVKVCSPEDRKTAETLKHQQALRLYNQLTEVRQQREEKARQEAFMRNREKAKEFQRESDFEHSFPEESELTLISITHSGLENCTKEENKTSELDSHFQKSEFEVSIIEKSELTWKKTSNISIIDIDLVTHIQEENKMSKLESNVQASEFEASIIEKSELTQKTSNISIINVNLVTHIQEENKMSELESNIQTSEFEVSITEKSELTWKKTSNNSIINVDLVTHTQEEDKMSEIKSNFQDSEFEISIIEESELTWKKTSNMSIIDVDLVTENQEENKMSELESNVQESEIEISIKEESELTWKKTSNISIIDIDFGTCIQEENKLSELESNVQESEFEVSIIEESEVTWKKTSNISIIDVDLVTDIQEENKMNEIESTFQASEFELIKEPELTCKNTSNISIMDVDLVTCIQEENKMSELESIFQASDFEVSIIEESELTWKKSSNISIIDIDLVTCIQEKNKMSERESNFQASEFEHSLIEESELSWKNTSNIYIIVTDLKKPIQEDNKMSELESHFQASEFEDSIIEELELTWKKTSNISIVDVDLATHNQEENKMSELESNFQESEFEVSIEESELTWKKTSNISIIDIDLVTHIQGENKMSELESNVQVAEFKHSIMEESELTLKNTSNIYIIVTDLIKPIQQDNKMSELESHFQAPEFEHSIIEEPELTWGKTSNISIMDVDFGMCIQEEKKMSELEFNFLASEFEHSISEESELIWKKTSNIYVIVADLIKSIQENNKISELESHFQESEFEHSIIEEPELTWGKTSNMSIIDADYGKCIPEENKMNELESNFRESEFEVSIIEEPEFTWKKTSSISIIDINLVTHIQDENKMSELESNFQASEFEHSIIEEPKLTWRKTSNPSILDVNLVTQFHEENKMSELESNFQESEFEVSIIEEPELTWTKASNISMIVADVIKCIQDESQMSELESNFQASEFEANIKEESEFTWKKTKNNIIIIDVDLVTHIKDKNKMKELESHFQGHVWKEHGSRLPCQVNPQQLDQEASEFEHSFIEEPEFTSKKTSNISIKDVDLVTGIQEENKMSELESHFQASEFEHSFIEELEFTSKKTSNISIKDVDLVTGIQEENKMSEFESHFQTPEFEYSIIEELELTWKKTSNISNLDADFAKCIQEENKMSELESYIQESEFEHHFTEESKITLSSNGNISITDLDLENFIQEDNKMSESKNHFQVEVSKDHFSVCAPKCTKESSSIQPADPSESELKKDNEVEVSISENMEAKQSFVHQLAFRLHNQLAEVKKEKEKKASQEDC